MSTNLLVFQMLHYAQQKQVYNELLTRAESVFPSTQIYDNWKTELSNAFHSQQSLDDFEFALNTFESLKTMQTSPMQGETELANITADPRFSAFTEIATLIDMPYSDTMFMPTVEMSQKISEETFFQPDLSILSTPTDELDKDVALSNMPKTDKVVLNIDDHGISNPEVLFTGDGYLETSRITTNKIENEKEKAFENAVETATTVEDVNVAINAISALNQIPTGKPVGDLDFATSTDSVYPSASSQSATIGVSDIIDSTLTSTIAEETVLAMALIEEERRKAFGEGSNPEATPTGMETGFGAGADLSGPCQ